eukprot:TRINITY_DN14214_c0_g1_i1.p1 TRINITY_DN14214_c0_g1~~TRINITY_DN14214_c0_g1_i1.p1  ORF type:complete len:190 (+),score=35.18 TRINITY_DN14214_c0_g1_i1:175-744(+)
MPYPKRSIGQLLGSATAPIVVEAFLDYLCPFSKKAYPRLKELVEHYQGQVAVRVINWLQPWHPQCFVVLRGAMAALQAGGIDAYWRASDQLFDAYDSFKDEVVATESRVQTEARIAAIVTEKAGVESAAYAAALKDSNLDMLIKFQQRYGRQNAIHVSPSFLINGLFCAEASSGWTLTDWKAVLDPLRD